MVSNLLLPPIFCLCLCRNVWTLMQANEQNLSRTFMIVQEQTLRRWPSCTSSMPTKGARRRCLNQKTWFGCTYSRTAFPNNARATEESQRLVSSSTTPCSREVVVSLFHRLHWYLFRPLFIQNSKIGSQQRKIWWLIWRILCTIAQMKWRSCPRSKLTATSNLSKVCNRSGAWQLKKILRPRN